MYLIPTVAEARNRARQSIDLARRGIHPVKQREQREAAQAAEKAAQQFTFGKLVERYLRERLEPNSSTVKEVGKLLARAAGYFADKPVADIRKGAILELITGRPPVLTNDMLAVVKRVFRWALAQDLVEVDPSASIQKPYEQKGRDRFLKDNEIVAFSHACDTIGWPFGPLFKLLLLTAQREAEVAGMRWSELDLNNAVWHLPGSLAHKELESARCPPV